MTAPIARITFAAPSLPDSGVIVVGVLDGRKVTPMAAEVDKRTGGALTRAMNASRFRGKKDETLDLLAPSDVKLDRVLLLGLGDGKKVDALQAQKYGGQLLAALNGLGVKSAAIALDGFVQPAIGGAEIAANIAYGARLRDYRFDKYRTKEKKEKKPTLGHLTIMTRETASAREAFEPLEKVADGVYFTRDLVSEPANIIYPETLAAQAATLKDLGVQVEILGVTEMKALGMGALLGVAQGSVREPRLVVLRWVGVGKDKDETSVAFVGKGVTFDSGGLSIKPASGMEDMKWDMGGAGVVIGLIKALAGRKAKVNAVGVVGLVENMPSGTAQRPGDIVTTMSGQTVEVLNTDAEGRLVLADALWYCQDRFKPKAMIDLATLTGAIIVSLGNEHAGLFSNEDKLAAQLMAAGTSVGEAVWRMPLGDAYDKMLESDAADMKNIGNRAAGSITAAQFLQRFVNKVAWAHLDIAGVTWSKKDAPTVPKGGTAFGVRLLERWVRDRWEK